MPVDAVAVTESAACWPVPISLGDGCAVIVGELQTSTVMALLFAVQNDWLIKRHQYVVVAAGATKSDAVVPPATGDAVLPLAPMYH